MGGGRGYTTGLCCLRPPFTFICALITQSNTNANADSTVCKQKPRKTAGSTGQNIFAQSVRNQSGLYWTSAGGGMLTENDFSSLIPIQGTT